MIKNKCFLIIISLLFFEMVLIAQSNACNYFYGPVSETVKRCNDQSWVLVFEDYFNGQLLSDDWTKKEGILRDTEFNKYKAWTSPSNVTIENDKLCIQTKEEYLENQCYFGICSDFLFTTGEVWSNMRFSYGKFEARIKIPGEVGLKPAYWLYINRNYYNEIDVFEFFHNDFSDLYTNVWYPDVGLGCSKESYSGTDFSESYHIFSVIWEKDKIEYFVDGNLIRTHEHYFDILGRVIPCTLNEGDYYYQNQQFPTEAMKVIFNTNVYNNQYSPNEYTVFPAKYEVDWFRYYKRFEPGNIIISQPIDLPTEEYNVLVGEDFIFNCEQIIHDGENLKIIASNSVTLLGGFQVVSGGQLEISIDNSIND